jgi:oligo-alginate lyase
MIREGIAYLQERLQITHTMSSPENISRRDLIKWMTLASAAMYGPVSLLADVVPGPVAETGIDGRMLMDHPRLIYNTASLKRLGQMLATDVAADAKLKKRGELLLATNLIPESVAMRGPGQHANYAEPADQMYEMGLTLGLLYQLTGDRRYAEKLREAMLYYAKYVRWTGQSFEHRGPPWHSELDTAKFGFGFATGYDALHAFLSDADRKTISDAMIGLAVLPILNDWVLPGTRIHSFDTMGHNWWGFCVAGAGMCALALLGEEPRAPRWIAATDAGFEEWFNYYPRSVLQNRVPTFERTGPSYEGVNYTKYGVNEYLHYRLAWQNTYPGQKPQQLEPLNHVARFYLDTLYPTSKGFYTVNFNDSSLQADATETMLLLIACGLGTPEASRYLQEVHSRSSGPMTYLLQPSPRPPVLMDARNSCIYPDMGWAVMRSSWENDATLLAMKSGYTWNHAHADAGSFILFKQGVPLIIDSGTCDYGRKEYSNYYCQSRAHNVILFDGAGQPKEDLAAGCKFPGKMHGLIDGLGLKYVYADATGPMARVFSRNYRHWLWSGDVILIIDDVYAHTPGQMDWLLHFEGQHNVDPDGTVRLKNGAAEAVVKMIYPPVTLREEAGLTDHNPDKKIPYLVFSPAAPMQSRQFITAICLNPNAVPKVEILQEKNYLGVRIQTPDAVEELYLNFRAVNSPDTSDMHLGDWVTDAYMLHFKRGLLNDQAVERFFMSDGSYLRYKGRSMIESLSKLSVCWAPGDSPEIFSDSTSASVQIATQSSPRSVKWNNRPVTAAYDGESHLASLHI